MTLWEVEDCGGRAATQSPGKAKTPSAQESNTFKVIGTIINPGGAIAEYGDNGGCHDAVHLRWGITMTPQLSDKLSGTGKNIITFMGHIAIKAHTNTKVFKRLRGGDCREGGPFVDKRGAYGLPCCKIMSRRLSFNNRNCDTRPT